MKKWLLILVCVCMLGGCSAAQEQNTSDTDTQAIKEGAINDKLKNLSFEMGMDYYARTVLQDGANITEMFVPEKNSFVRIAITDNEEEVFSYNYVLDEFKYLYYFSDELISQVVYNIGDNEVLDDEDGLIDFMRSDADELKKYFKALIETADIEIEELVLIGG